MRKQAIFIIAPHIKDVKGAYNAWPLEGEEQKQIKPDLLRRHEQFKAQDILNRKEQQYRKYLNQARLN
jgi:hypothetical protein